jgi:hypothetical protein
MKTQQKIKSNLITYYEFKECDFFELDGITYLNCQNNAGEIASDVLEELELQRKEKFNEMHCYE